VLRGTNSRVRTA